MVFFGSPRTAACARPRLELRPVRKGLTRRSFEKQVVDVAADSRLHGAET